MHWTVQWTHINNFFSGHIYHRLLLFLSVLYHLEFYTCEDKLLKYDYTWCHVCVSVCVMRSGAKENILCLSWIGNISHVICMKLDSSHKYFLFRKWSLNYYLIYCWCYFCFIVFGIYGLVSPLLSFVLFRLRVRIIFRWKEKNSIFSKNKKLHRLKVISGWSKHA